MIFSQTIRYHRRMTDFTKDERQGAAVAHAELLEAVLQHSEAEEVQIIDTYSTSREECCAALEDLRRRFPSKCIQISDPRYLLRISPETDHVIYTAGVYITPLAQMRVIANANYPICAVVHSLDFSPSVCAAWTLPQTRPHDAIIVSSAAGEVALKRLLETTRALAGLRPATEHTGPGIYKIPLGVDPTSLKPIDRMYCRQSLQIDSDALVLLYVGRFTKEHKADLVPLLLAVKELAADYPKIRLIMAGSSDGPYSREVELQAEKFGIGHRISIIRNFAPFLKPVIFSAADIFVSPVDNVQETFGIALLEAMSCGLPVVAADWSGYRDIVVHGRTGLLVPTLWNSHASSKIARLAPLYDEARYALSEQTVIDVRSMIEHLRALASNAELRSTYGREGRKRIQSLFSWGYVIQQHEALWRELLSLSRAKAMHDGSGIIDDYPGRFEHYATRTISDDTVVCRGRELIDWEPPVRTASGLGIDIALADAIAVIQGCEAGPVPINSIRRKHGEKAMEIVTWMLKRGYLEIDHSSSSNAIEDLYPEYAKVVS